jgi:hypothetical protein
MTAEMNEFLAELYGTGTPIQNNSGGEVEKLAQAEVLDQVLTQEGISLDQLTGDQIMKVAHDLFGPGNEIEKIAAEGKACETCKKDPCECKEAETMEEKVAEADFLGRVMAHSFWQENGTIEKDASSAGIGRMLAAGRAAKAAPKEPGKAMKALKDLKEKYKYQRAIGGGRLGSAAEVAGPKGTAAAGAAGAGAGYAAGREKKGSALDALAEHRALELLKEAGITPEAAQPAAETEQEKLAQAVEARAWEMLEANGYVASE